jgi:hypothetical protein
MVAVLSTTGKITKGEYVNEWAQANDTQWVHKVSIIGTDFVDYSVWEPTPKRLPHAHHTITHHGDLFLGDITTREIPGWMEALKGGSPERIRAVTGWYDANKAEARVLILATFPHDFDGLAS